MSGATVALILNLLLIVVLLIGFFIGVVRGAKKQGVRSLYFIGFLIVFLLLSPLISGACVNIQINGQTLAQFIETQMASNPEMADVLSNPTMQELITKLPLVVINLAVVFVLVLLALLFSGIAYIITKHVHLNKYKREAKKLKKAPQTPNDKTYTVKDGKPVVIDKVEPKSKRYRWWGGLIGAVTGFVIMFALLLPVTGVARTAMTYIDFSAKADEVAEEPQKSNFEYEYISNFLKESLGEDVIDILKGVNDSVFIKVTSVGNLDLALFDTISTVKVNGEKVTLRTEVKAVAEVAESVLYVQDAIPQTNGEFNFEEMDWQTLDFDKLEKTINSLFASGILRSLGNEIIATVFTDDFVDQNIKEGNELFEYKHYIKEVFKEIATAYDMTNEKSIDQLKNDLLAILGIAEATVESGLADFLSNPKNEIYNNKTEFDVVVECLYGKNTNSKVENHDYLKDITDSMFTSTTFKGVLVAGVNIACDLLKTEINNMLAKQQTQPTGEVEFSTLSQENIDWTAVSTTFKDILDKGIDVYKIYQNEIAPIMEDQTLDETQIAKKLLSNTKFAVALDNVGEILNNIIDSPLFKVASDTPEQTEVSLIDEVLNELNKVEKINQYVDLNELKGLDWGTELNIFADFVGFVAPILSANEDGEYSNLEYDQLKTAVDKLFEDSTIAKAIKTDWIKDAVGYNDLGEPEKEIYDIIFDEDVKTVADLKNVVVPIVNIVADLGKAGVFDLIYKTTQNDEFFVKDITDNLDFVCTKLLADNSKPIKDILDNLTANDKLKTLIITAFNNFVAPQFEVEQGDVGTLVLPETEDVWTTAKTNIQTLAELCLKAIQNAEIQGQTKHDDVQNIVNALVSSTDTTTLLEQIGVAADNLLECDLFQTSQNGSALKNILFNILKDNEQFSYDKTDDFWAGETTLWVEPIEILNYYVVGDNTLLELLINGNDNDSLMTGLKDLKQTEIESISYALCNTKFLAKMKVDLEASLLDAVNEINEGVVEIVGEEPTEIKGVAVVPQLSAVINVVKIAESLADTNKSTLEDIVKDATAKGRLVDLLTTLQTGDKTQDYVFSTTYATLFNYISTNYGELESVDGKTAQNIVWADVVDEIELLPQE